MLFTDDAARHAYHKAPALLQVVCQVLENNAANYGLQVELVDCERNHGMWVAALALSDEIPEEALTQLVAHTNQHFKRTDEVPTCQIESAEVSLLSIRVSDRSDFSMLV